MMMLAMTLLLEVDVVGKGITEAESGLEHERQTFHETIPIILHRRCRPQSITNTRISS